MPFPHPRACFAPRPRVFQARLCFEIPCQRLYRLVRPSVRATGPGPGGRWGCRRFIASKVADGYHRAMGRVREPEGRGRVGIWSIVEDRRVWFVTGFVLVALYGSGLVVWSEVHEGGGLVVVSLGILRGLGEVLIAAACIPFAILQGVDMTGVMTQWMKERLARQREEARQQALREGHEKGHQEGHQEGREEGRLETSREANARARQQGMAPLFPEVEDDPSEDR